MKAHAPKTAALMALEADLLSAESERILRRHLVECEVCQSTLASMRAYDALAQSAREIPAPEVDWDRMDFALRREARVSAEGIRRARSNARSGSYVWAGFAAALAFAFLGPAVLAKVSSSSLFGSGPRSDVANEIVDVDASDAEVSSPSAVASGGRGTLDDEADYFDLSVGFAALAAQASEAPTSADTDSEAQGGQASAVRLFNATASRPAPAEIEAGVVQRVVRASSDRLTRCYEQALRLDPTLGARMTVRVTVDAAGRVGNVLVDGRDERPSAVALSQCVTRNAQGWAFPARPGAPSTVVRVPLDFGAR